MYAMQIAGANAMQTYKREPERGSSSDLRLHPETTAWGVFFRGIVWTRKFSTLPKAEKSGLFREMMGSPSGSPKMCLVIWDTHGGVIESLTFQKNGEGCDLSAPPQEPKKWPF